MVHDLQDIQAWVVRQILFCRLSVPRGAVVWVVAVVEEELLAPADVPVRQGTGDGSVSRVVEEPLSAVVIKVVVHLGDILHLTQSFTWAIPFNFDFFSNE